MLLLRESLLEQRRATSSAGDMGAVAAGLAAELQPLLHSVPAVPVLKALLSRAGGRCERDGATLDFDPFSATAHRCPVCGTMWTGKLHDGAWATSYHLWLIERAVHAALLHALHGDVRHAALAREILRGYAAAYLLLPNRDNVLGPTRLFFSTYLESIWLLNACVAADLLAHEGDDATAALLLDRIIEPSSLLIAEYDEGMSNRQVWNNAALLAAALLTRDAPLVERVVHGESGLVAHLRRALLPDATWYEGENYHLFALRGLWYGVTMCESHDVEIPAPLRARFDRAFVAPYLTALPDFTMPSRKDSQYAISLAQWRLAELAELGFARSADPTLAWALTRCYDPGRTPGDTGRAYSTADVERNRSPVRLTRADLGWRALLHAVPELHSPHVAQPRSTLLESQGIAVFRRDGDVHVCLDYGESGGGHGHPDRLNLTLAQGTFRWLDDLGTGSYLDPSLHWYRSTLAHNAPLVNGRSQPFHDGRLDAWDERDGVGWAAASFHVLEQDVRLERAIVVTPDYIVDDLRCATPGPVRLELPWHLDAPAPASLSFESAALRGGDDPADGFAFVSDARVARLRAGEPVTIKGKKGSATLEITLLPARDAQLFSAAAPGQPADRVRHFYIVRHDGSPGVTTGADIVLRAVVAWQTGFVARDEGESIVVERAGERHVHTRTADGWRVELQIGGARSTVDLGGARAPLAAQAMPVVDAALTPVPLQRTGADLPTWPDTARHRLVRFELGEQHYRRSEESWHDAGKPAADVAFAASHTHLLVWVAVRAGDPRFPEATAVNPFDNEAPDTLGAGVQLYFRTPDGSGAWMLVPEPPGDEVRVRPLAAWGAWPLERAHWRRTASGYELSVMARLPESARAGEYPVDVDVIVNETTAERVRRRGQLVLSGARREFVYLRGDRHDAGRLIPLVLLP